MSESTDFERLIRICESERAEDREALRQVALPAGTWLAALASDPKLGRIVLLNKRLPPKVLQELARDAAADIRLTIATKRATDPDTLISLGHDPDESVRAMAVRNHGAPQSLVNELLDDPSWMVREAAAEANSHRAGKTLPGDPRPPSPTQRLS